MPPFSCFDGAFCPHTNETAVGDSVISEQDEVDIPPETNGLPEDGAEIAENVMSDADAMEKETTE